MNDIKFLLTATLRLRILIRLLSRFSKQIDVNIDINTDFCVTENFFFTEEVFTRVFHFVIVMMTMTTLRKAVRSIL